MKSFFIAIIIGLIIGFVFIYNKNLELKDKYRVLGEINHYTLYKQEPEFCATALEVIYEDEENVYYFSCIKSEHYFLKNMFRTIKLKEALQTNLISIKELTKLEPNIIIHPKDNWYNSHIPAGEYILMDSQI